MATEDAKNTPSQEQMPDKGRRDTLKTLATVPILGALAYGVYQKRKDALRGRNISDVFQVSNRQASYLEPQGDGKKIRIGLIANQRHTLPQTKMAVLLSICICPCEVNSSLNGSQ